MRANAATVVTAPVAPTLALVPYTRALVPTYHAWMEDAALRAATASERLSLDEELAMCDAWAGDDDKLTFIIVVAEEEGEARRAGAASTTATATAPPTDGGRPQRRRYAPVGDVNLFFNDADAPSRAEVEVMVAVPAARRRGVARTAVALLLAYAAALPPPRGPLTRAVAKIGRANAASGALFQTGLGFARVGGSDVFQEDWFEMELASPAGAALLASVAGWAATPVGEFGGEWGG
jgi:RimJ/RimL family protein N-acetyltransferase